jgi:hypothetical protein
MASGGPLAFTDIPSPPLPAQQPLQGGGELSSFGGQPYWRDTTGGLWALTPAGGSAVPWATGPVAASQSYTEVSHTYTPLFSVQGTGGTDTVQPFQLAAGAGTYGTTPPVLGPVLALGYNTVAGMSKTTGTSGAATINFFADAGDTNSSGAHGVEINLSWFGPSNATGATAAFQMVAVNDTTNTVTTSIRCGSGSSGGYSSSINFTNASATITFMVMSNANNAIYSYVPTFVLNGSATTAFEVSTGSTASASAQLLLEAIGTSGQVQVFLNGNDGSGANSTIFFQTNTTTQWQLEHTPPYLYIRDVVNNRSACYFYPGATAAAARVQLNSVVQPLSSLVCGSAALATTATDGFLYLPTCAGAPTGIPTAWAGTVPCVFDTTDGKIYYYTGGAWVGLAD